MPFDGAGFEDQRGRQDPAPARRGGLREILSWVFSFSAVWLPFLAALLWVELH